MTEPTARVLARRGGWRRVGFLLLLLALAVGWTAEGYFGWRETTGPDAVVRFLQMVVVGTAGLAYLGWWTATTLGPRSRSLVATPHALLVRMPFRDIEIPWDRVTKVSTIERQRGYFRALRWINGSPPAFHVHGVGIDGRRGGLTVNRRGYPAKEVARIHERLLDELGQRFGQVDRDWWDAATDAKGTPAASDAERRNAQIRQDARELAIEMGMDPDAAEAQPLPEDFAR